MRALSQKRPSDFFVPGGGECIAPVVIGDADQDGVLDDKDECEDTPIGVKVNDVGCSDYNLEEGVVFLDIKFMNASFDLLDSSSSILQGFAEDLNKYDFKEILVEGHSSKVGNYEFNKELSIRRAKSVLDALVSYGVDPEKISSVGVGSDRPILDEDSDEAYEINRRVEIHVSY